MADAGMLAGGASAVIGRDCWRVRFGREVWLGMLAPLVVVSVTWVLTERVYRRSPSG